MHTKHDICMFPYIKPKQNTDFHMFNEKPALWALNLKNHK